TDRELKIRPVLLEIQQHGPDLQLAIGLNLFYERLLDSIPIFECRFQVSVNEVNRGQEIVGIRIKRINLYAAPEPCQRLTIVFLLVSYPAKLDGKSLVVRS